MNPTGIGGFQKGQSGNPGGRPAELAEVKALAREQTEASIAALVTIRDDATAPANARVAAANSLLDRAWGKPTQALEHSGPNGGPIIDHSAAREFLMAKLNMLAEHHRATDGLQPRENDSGVCNS